MLPRNPAEHCPADHQMRVSKIENTLSAAALDGCSKKIISG